MVGEWSAQASFARRVQVRSVTSNSFLWSQVLDIICSVYGGPLVEGVYVLEAVIDVLSGGATGGRGVA